MCTSCSSQLESRRKEIAQERRPRDVLSSCPIHLLSDRTAGELLTFSEQLDRVAARTDKGHLCVLQETLSNLFGSTVETPVATAFVSEIERVPDARVSARDLPPVRWAELADEVVVFDPRLEVNGIDLHLPDRPMPEELVSAINRRFPSMEKELIGLTPVVPRIEELISRLRQSLRAGGIDPSVRRVFDLAGQNLGWWACVGLVLVLAAGARSLIAFSDANPLDPAYVWPTYVFLLTAAMGGWTLTMLESLILAR